MICKSVPSTELGLLKPDELIWNLIYLIITYLHISYNEKKLYTFTLKTLIIEVEIISKLLPGRHHHTDPGTQTKVSEYCFRYYADGVVIYFLRLGELTWRRWQPCYVATAGALDTEVGSPMVVHMSVSAVGIIVSSDRLPVYSPLSWQLCHQSTCLRHTSRCFGWFCVSFASKMTKSCVKHLQEIILPYSTCIGKIILDLNAEINETEKGLSNPLNIIIIRKTVETPSWQISMVNIKSHNSVVISADLALCRGHDGHTSWKWWVNFDILCQWKKGRIWFDFCFTFL